MDVLKKWMFSQKLLFKSSLLLNGSCGIQVRPPNNGDILFAFSSVFILLLCEKTKLKRCCKKKSAKATFLTAISHLVAHFFAVALFEDGVAIFLANILRACAQRDRHAKTLLQIILQIGCCSSSPFNSFLPCLLHIAGFVSWISYSNHLASSLAFLSLLKGTVSREKCSN